MDTLECKVVVIGGGPAGYTAAIRCGQLGAPVVLVDEGGLGGVCLREGCIPSKALIGATKAVSHVQELLSAGVVVGDVRIDPDRLAEFKDKVVSDLMNGLRDLMKANRVKVLEGRGEIAGLGRVVAHTPGGVVECRTEAVIVATGSVPITLPVLPVDGVRVWSSSHALFIPEVPSSLAVVGAGYVGLELATVYARLGSRVTVIEVKGQVLPGIDRDLAQVVATRLRRLGVEVLTDAAVLSADTKGDDIVLQVDRHGKALEVRCSKVLLAVGRRPSLLGLGLETIGLEAASFFDVDDRMQTRVPWVFAAGDVTGPPLLAHKAHMEGEVAAEAACGHRKSLRARVVPAVAFTDPEVAVVGLSEAQAAEKGVEYIKGRFPLAALGRAHADSAQYGLVKVLADPKTHELLGVGMAGAGAGEVIAEATLAVEKRLPLEDVEAVIHSHPTYAEAFQEACRAALGRAIHVVNR